jgi:hypothetical protein
MCPENPAPWDVFGWRCRFLAEGLAAKTNQPVQNFMWMDYGQLEALTALGTAADVTGGARRMLDNAAIIPRLFRDNPQAALQALQQFACQNQGTVQGFTATALIASAQIAAQSGVFGSGSAVAGASAGGGFSAGGVGLVVIGGIIIAVGAVIAWDELTRPNEFAAFDYDTARQAATVEIARRLANPVVLFRGTALSRVYNREGLFDNRLWVFRESHFFEAVGYAQRDALIENDTAAVAVYGMVEQTFNGLIASGNIRVRFGLEYGLDAVAQAFLVGPAVIPIPDMRQR